MVANACRDFVAFVGAIGYAPAPLQIVDMHALQLFDTLGCEDRPVHALHCCRFTPMDFILPPILWLAVGKRSWYMMLLNYSIIIIYSIIAVAGAIGSVQAIAGDVSNYSVFADLF